MINLNLLKKDFDLIKEKILLKAPSFNVDKMYQLYLDFSNKKIELEALYEKQNKLSKAINKDNLEQFKIETKELSFQIKNSEEKVKELEKDFEALYFICPNLPQNDLPKGNKESNKVLKKSGERTEFDFIPKTHYELLENRHIDFKRGSKISKSGFMFYNEQMTELIYALAQFFIKHNKSFGYKLTLPPYLVNYDTLFSASNMPIFKEDIFTLSGDDLYLIPTAEVALAGLYKDEILNEYELPLRLTAWTSCFRREAGGYGASERGMIRIHQFEKVELFTLCKEEDGEKEHLRMVECAESLLGKLKLHYQTVLLAAQDCSFASSKTYDLEVYFEGQKEYKEVSSISNCTDFQARRGKIRYKNMQDGKNHLVHTLNGSSLALPRIIIALVEKYQKKDGGIDFDSILNLLS